MIASSILAATSSMALFARGAAHTDALTTRGSFRFSRLPGDIRISPLRFPMPAAVRYGRLYAMDPTLEDGKNWGPSGDYRGRLPVPPVRESERRPDRITHRRPEPTLPNDPEPVHPWDPGFDDRLY